MLNWDDLKRRNKKGQAQLFRAYFYIYTNQKQKKKNIYIHRALLSDK